MSDYLEWTYILDGEAMAMTPHCMLDSHFCYSFLLNSRRVGEADPKQFWPAAKTAPDERHLAAKLDSFVQI
ncbi:MAG: hypothetical protein JW918_16320, partial [Anaerolineae bacterium]|nr:hypothetical protein [Anaerolineae bacterium]